MAFGTITSTSNTFGSVDGTATGSVPGTLSGSVGVPGPQGPAGSTGATGPAGAAGVGVPVGGTTGQALVKTSNTDYATGWTTLNLTQYWGGITGTLSSQTDLQAALDLKYDASNPDGFIDGSTLDNYLTKVDNLGSLADPEVARNNLGLGTMALETASNYAMLGSPVFTGNPTAPTATFGDNDTSIATTAFVQAGLLGGTANARNLEVEVRNQSGSTIPAGSIVYISGATGNLPLITLAQANNDANSAQTIGFVKTAITNNGTGYVIVRGVLEAINTSALTEGVQLYLSPTTAGTWTTTKPSAPQHLVYVGVVIRSHPTQGTILVAVQNGYELHELHDVALASEANNDLLVYELSTDLWKNKSFATLGLAGLNSPTFTGTPSLPTGTIGVTQTAGNNTTALATTAFVTAAVPAFATDAQAVAGTSTTTVMTPAANYWADKKSGHSFVQFNTIAAAGSGSGAQAVLSAGGYAVGAPTTAVGHGVGSFSFPAAQRGINRGNGSWNWSKAFTATFRYSRNSTATDANSISRVTFGKNNAVGDPVINCVGIRMTASNAMQLIVHNGTTLTAVTTTSSFVPTVPITCDIRIVSDGAGNVQLYINDTLEATTTAGPTGTSGTSSASAFMTEAQNTAIITGSPASHGIYNLHFEFAD